MVIPAKKLGSIILFASKLLEIKWPIQPNQPGREGKGPEQVVLERTTLSPLSGFGTAQCRMPVKGHIDEKDSELQSSVKPGVLLAQFTSLRGKNATRVHHDSVQALRIPTG